MSPDPGRLSTPNPAFRRAALVFALLLAARTSSARHAVQHDPPPNVENEFRYVAGALECVSGTPSTEPLSPCLHIGAIGLGQTEATVEAILGKPWRIVAVDDEATMSLFPLHGDLDASPYLAVRFRAGRVDAIQLSGVETPDPYSFAGLRLGDADLLVRKILGPVRDSEKLVHTHVTLFSYLPVPISIEVRDRRVVSIKIWRGGS